MASVHPFGDVNSQQLTQLLPGLYATPTGLMPYGVGLVVRSFVLSTRQGTVVVYNSPGIDAAAAEIKELGDPARLLINHWHEEMYGSPKEFSIPTFIHHADQAQLSGRLAITECFDGPMDLDDELRVIPTPGHTEGAAAYLWDNGEHRVLFTGDTLWDHEDLWSAVIVGESDREEYIRSLQLLASLDFDVVAPWVSHRGDDPVMITDREDARSRIEQAVERLRTGAHC